MNAKTPEPQAYRDPADGTLGKAEFGRFLGVSPSRVSQYIADGKIDGDALIMVAGRPRVRVDAAMAQLRERLDPGQMTGNGKKTRLAVDDAVIAISPSNLARIEALIAVRLDKARDEILRTLRTLQG